MSTNILLNSINDVKSFVNTVSKYNCDVDLISGRYVIDAKSNTFTIFANILTYRKVYKYAICLFKV